MIKVTRKRNSFAMYSSIMGIFISIIALSISAYAYGPGNPYGGGCGMGRGLHRDSGFVPGHGPGQGAGLGCNAMGTGGPGGWDLQRGIAGEPPYCRILMDRQDLKLTTEQKESLRKLQINHMKETFDLRSDLQISKIELKKVRFSKNPDFNLIKSKLEKISKLQLDIQLSRIKLQIEADKILTEQQKDALYLSPDMGLDVEWEEEMPPEEIPPPDNEE